MGRCLLLLLAPLMLGAQDCPLLDLDANGTTAGTLEAGDCLFKDLVPGSTSTVFVDRYRIVTPGRGVLTLRLDSAAYDTALYLYDGKGNRVTQNQGRMALSLNPGTYIVFAASTRPASGAYTLASTHEPLRECAPQALTFGTRVAAELSASDCRIMDLRVPSADDTLADTYRFTLERRGFVRLDLTSSAFSPYIALMDSQNRRIAVTDSNIPPPGAHIAIGLEPGTYTVYANSSRAATGSYTLAATFEEAKPCPVSEIRTGSPASGTLALEGCRLADVLSPQPDLSRVDLYRLTVAERAVFTIDMASNQFDTYLLIFDEQYRYIGEADDISTGNTNSRLIASLTPGSYIVMANTYEGTGAYTLQVSSGPPRDCPSRDLAAPATVSGAISTLACRVLDTVSPSADQTPADVYRLTLTSPAVLAAQLDSREFDAWLVLAGPARQMIAEDNDGAGDTNSRIETLLLPGEYYVLANTANGIGAYTLRAEVRDAPSCPVSDLRAGETAAAELDAGGCRLLDALPGNRGTGAVSRFRVTLANAATLRVNAASPDFSPSVLVLDSDNREQGKDARTLSTAEIAVPLQPGAYTIAVTPAAGEGGHFTLETSLR